jgi:hypothetical protein
VFDRLLAAIAKALDAESLPYMVIGGQAVLLHGEPRLTKDIDVTLAAGLERLDAVLRAASAAGLDPLVDPKEFTQTTMVLPCKDTVSRIRVDFIFSFSRYEKHAVSRAKLVLLAGTNVRFASAEDLIVHKILAGRPRDLEDIRSILLKNPGLNVEFVRSTLAEFDEALARGDELASRFDAVHRETRSD